MKNNLKNQKTESIFQNLRSLREISFLSSETNDSPNNLIRNLLMESKKFWVIVIKILSELFIIFGPSMNYMFQIIKLYRTKSSKGFSKFLCLITILSHTFRIFFWFGKAFKISLLYQSFLVVTILLFLIHLCLKFDDRNINKRIKETKENENEKNNKTIFIEIKNFFKKLFDFSKTFKLKLIWKWENEIEYYKFYFFLIFAIGFICKSFGYKYQRFINSLGLISVVLENFATIPQIVEIYQTKNTKNISNIMIFMWLGGNLFKTIYNIIYRQPFLLIMGALACVAMNGFLAAQVVYYKNIDKIKETTNWVFDQFGNKITSITILNEYFMKDVKLFDKLKNVERSNNKDGNFNESDTENMNEIAVEDDDEVIPVSDDEEDYNENIKTDVTDSNENNENKDKEINEKNENKCGKEKEIIGGHEIKKCEQEIELNVINENKDKI